MPRVDFYILLDNATNGRLLLACRLVEKAYLLGHSVYVHAGSVEQARQFDELLWTFRQGGFVPHALCPVGEEDISPVRIGWRQEPETASEVLVNLSDRAPGFFEKFQRVVEVADQDSQTLQQSRERFRFYRERGCSPQSHKL